MNRLGAALALPLAAICAVAWLGLVSAWALWKTLCGQVDVGWSRFEKELEFQRRILRYYIKDLRGGDE